MGPIPKPKSVVLLIETLNRGGIETVLLRLLPKLKEEGWSSTIITIRDGGEMLAEYRQAGIAVIPLGQKYFLSPKTLLAIYRHINDLQPNLIMTNLFKADVIGRLFLRLAVHQPVVPYLVTTYNHPRYWVARVFELLTKPLGRDYIANSEAVQQFYEKRLGVASGRIVVAPNGVDPDIFSNADAKPVRTELGLPPNAFVVTCVANLAPNKGQADLLEAFDQTFADQPHAFLLLVGEGEQRTILTAQRETLRSKRQIILLGRRTDVPSILKATTVFALPTLFEGMSTALLEAMAAGKAIVTTDIPENKVLFTHNKNALLFKPKDRKQLSSALRQMYASPSLRNRLGRAAHEHMVAHYSIAQMARTFATIFDKISHWSRRAQTRIIHVIGSLESGGAENMLLRVLPLLNDSDFEQIVITLFRPGSLTKKMRAKGVTTINIGQHSVLDLRSWRELSKRVKQLEPGLVITYLFHAGLIGRLYLQRRLEAPVIPFLRTTYNFPRYMLVRLFERATKSLIHHYFANSEAVKKYYVKNIGVLAKKITVIPNGIDLTVFNRADGDRIARELKLPPRRFVISCVANLAVNKGHTYVLEAFERMFRVHPEAYLLLVGTGEEEKNLMEQIRPYASRSHIFFLGQRGDVPDILAASDAFVLPTLFEGMSNAILEAMAAGMPVITTDIPENRAIITDGVSGFLVKPRDSQAIQDATEMIIKDAALRTRVGQRAKAYVTNHLALSQVTRQWRGEMNRWARHG